MPADGKRREIEQRLVLADPGGGRGAPARIEADPSVLWCLGRGWRQHGRQFNDPGGGGNAFVAMARQAVAAQGATASTITMHQGYLGDPFRATVHWTATEAWVSIGIRHGGGEVARIPIGVGDAEAISASVGEKVHHVSAEEGQCEHRASRINGDATVRLRLSFSIPGGAGPDAVPSASAELTVKGPATRHGKRFEVNVGVGERTALALLPGQAGPPRPFGGDYVRKVRRRFDVWDMDGDAWRAAEVDAFEYPSALEGLVVLEVERGPSERPLTFDRTGYLADLTPERIGNQSFGAWAASGQKHPPPWADAVARGRRELAAILREGHRSACPDAAMGV